MRFVQVRVHGARCIESAELEFGPGTNLLLGANGAGKTSLLESLYLLSYGRTFRKGPRWQLVRLGASLLTVHAVVAVAGGGTERLGIELDRTKETWRGSINGAGVDNLGALLQRCAICCFEPGSQDLIAGGSERRRAFVDWALFHVEPDFWDTARRYRRALAQRNALLGQSAAGNQLEAWEQELERHGQRLSTWRGHYLEQALLPGINSILASLMPELGPARLHWSPGWTQGDDDVPLTLAESLFRHRERDRRRGHTTQGPHRADWRLSFANAPARENLSRGQTKTVALAAMLAQAHAYHATSEDWPILCLDDPASELDARSQDRLMTHLAALPAQVLITGTSRPAGPLDPAARVFHVEHGVIAPA